MGIRTIKDFIKLESTSGLLLFVSAFAALIISNSSAGPSYHEWLATPFSIHIGILSISKPLLLWINDGLMAVFFLLIGLEVKKDLIEGELSSVRKAALPAIAAIGGMTVPALIFAYFNQNHPHAMQGWAIPVATDIAFSLGILAMLKTRVPISLKIFLTALAIFDDIGAIVIIAFFYSHKMLLMPLVLALICIVLLMLFNRFKLMSLTPYLIVGGIMWLFVLESGVHATLAGVILAMVIPLRTQKEGQASPLRSLEAYLHPYVAYLILPIFAFANAGVTLQGIPTHDFYNPIFLGISLGLCIGNPIGITLATYIAVKLRIASLPKDVGWLHIIGVSMVCGVGFTMSYFIGTLAFGDTGMPTVAYVKLGVLTGSAVAGTMGYLFLRFLPKHPDKKSK